ncbi:hypothetical protein BaOVIS_011020 [Babesia ovis]|uniref:Uncharacterized protein n=1 Tax=Babesia ovis TaxID=5869 RepID=A0A9W5WU99_BABOV|nr:hypothetical protein BaOVIS_011020 [Babesia ovis]
MEDGQCHLGSGRVGIQVTVGDSYHLSGGPFCCFVRVAPIASNWSDPDDRVTIDFISLNVYGLVTFRDRLPEPSRLQSNLHFGFLKEARRLLKPNETCHLIFASDAVIFSTCAEIGQSSPECFYRYMCTIPPFVPPTIISDSISCTYYVHTAVQYSSGLHNVQREILHRRLEFSLVGSIYPGVPTLDNGLYPFLPKSEGYRLEGGRVDDSLMPKVCSDIINENYCNGNMFFNYDTQLDQLDSDGGNSELRAAPLSDKFLLSRDLNAYWHVWDTMNGSNLVHEPEESYMLRRYNGFIDRVTNLILKDPTEEQFEQLRPWFGSMLFPGISNDSENITDAPHTGLLQLFYKKVEERHAEVHGTTVESLRQVVGDSLEVQCEEPPDGRSQTNTMHIVHSDSTKTLNFSFDGRRFCVCTLQGFSQRKGSDEFTLPTNSWFTVAFDFPDPFLCLQVDITLARCDYYTSDKHNTETTVLQRSLFTLGKSQTSVTLFVPISTTPSFISSYLQVSYKLKLCFYHFPETTNISRVESTRIELGKLRILQWDYPLRILQSESLRVQARCFTRDEPTTMEQTLYLARGVSSRSNTSGLLRGGITLSTTLEIK